jgi:hypothetical protein
MSHTSVTSAQISKLAGDDIKLAEKKRKFQVCCGISRMETLDVISIKEQPAMTYRTQIYAAHICRPRG